MSAPNYHRLIAAALFAACFAGGFAATPAAAQYYEYDAAGRLIYVAYREGGGIAYSYDLADNMTAATPLSLPAAPVEVEVTRLSDTSARVTWGTTVAATGYVIERRREGSSSWEEIARVSAQTTTFVDPNLEAGAQYSYRISALSANGRSAPSSEATFSGLPAPSISQNGVVNGASFVASRPIAPGSIVSIFGSNIGIRAAGGEVEAFNSLAGNIPLPGSLEGYSVLFNGEEAPLFFVGGREETSAGQTAYSGQVNAQVPWDIEAGPVEVTLRREQDGQLVTSSAVEALAAPVSPSIFTFDFGPGRAAAINIVVNAGSDVINGSVVQPANSIPGVTTQAAPIGGAVTIFANGLGPVEPPARTGDNSLDALRSVTIPVQVFVGGVEAQVLFAGLNPQFVALYQINILIPAGVAPGDTVPVEILQAGVRSRNDVTIAVRPQ